MEIKKVLSPSESELAKLNSKFWDFVSSKTPDLPAESRDKKFLFSAMEEAEFIGGICGNVYWNGLEIDTIWVEECHQGKGVGVSLLMEAEKYAIGNGAVVSFLKTVDAKEFYEKSGYQVYGILEDRPIGTFLYHMKTRLDGKKSL